MSLFSALVNAVYKNSLSAEVIKIISETDAEMGDKSPFKISILGDTPIPSLEQEDQLFLMNVCPFFWFSAL